MIPQKKSVFNSDFLDSQECALILKAMADPTRLRLLRHLVRGEKYVLELVHELKIDQPTVSHHLTILKRAGLVLEQRQGRRVLNRLHPAASRHLSSKEKSIELGCCSVVLRPD